MKIYLIMFGVGGLIAWCVWRNSQSQSGTDPLTGPLLKDPVGQAVKTGQPLWELNGVFPTRSKTVSANETATAVAIRAGGWTGTSRPITRSNFYI